MEFLVPLLIVLIICVIVVLGAWFLGRRSKSGNQAAGLGGADSGVKMRANPAITRELAAASSAQLTPEQHRAVYSLIARQQQINAIKEFRRATGCSLREAALAVASLDQFPQATPEPEWTGELGAEAPDADAKNEDVELPVAPDSPAGIESAGTVVPDSPAGLESLGRIVPEMPATPMPARGAYRYRAIVSKGDEIREVASTRLNEEIFQQIRALALAGKLDDAAALLAQHSDIGAIEAQEFVAMIEPED
jgi:ribosomal protein L7/L12